MRKKILQSEVYVTLNLLPFLEKSWSWRVKLKWIFTGIVSPKLSTANCLIRKKSHFWEGSWQLLTASPLGRSEFVTLVFSLLTFRQKSFELLQLAVRNLYPCSPVWFTCKLIYYNVLHSSISGRLKNVVVVIAKREVTNKRRKQNKTLSTQFGWSYKVWSKP